MATDERNFRSSYYERVGCLGVEEKKSIEILLKEKPWDKVKLKQFCLRFAVPAAYRNLLWKVLLGVLPVYKESHQFVMEQRVRQYNELLHALQVMEIVSDKTSTAQRFLAMWHLETGQHQYEFTPQMDCGLVPISETLLELYQDDVDVYWLAKGFYSIVESFDKDMQRLLDFSKTLLEKEDQELHDHLIDNNIYDSLPISKWFKCLFAGILDDTSLAKIWDKLCAGAPKMLSFVAVVLLIALRRSLLKANTPEEALRCVTEIPDQSEEVIANKAIELWQYYGSLPVQSDNLPKK